MLAKSMILAFFYTFTAPRILALVLVFALPIIVLNRNRRSFWLKFIVFAVGVGFVAGQVYLDLENAKAVQVFTGSYDPWDEVIALLVTEMLWWGGIGTAVGMLITVVFWLVRRRKVGGQSGDY